MDSIDLGEEESLKKWECRGTDRNPKANPSLPRKKSTVLPLGAAHPPLKYDSLLGVGAAG